MSFLQFAQERGLIINHLERGKWARVPTVDHPHKKNGAYFFDETYGFCQNWAEMESVDVWHENKPRTTFEQADLNKRMAEAKAKQSQNRSRRQHRAAGKAKFILSQCELDKHAYLDSKGFSEMRGNVWKQEGQEPLLIVPMYSGSDLCGCQCIGIDGEKKFLYGQRTNDAFFRIGQTGREIICEGYATALSIHAILAAAKIPATIYATFSVGNATRVAKQLPNAFWIADRDQSGVGQNAAAESGLKWWAPPVIGTDANDWHQEVGLFKAAMELKRVLMAR